MYCPSCKSEFREGIDYCSQCECALVEALPHEEAAASDENEVLLVNVRDEYEADIIESILSSNGIKATKRYREAGDYLTIYMGSTVLGCDIYVLESDYESAKELIESEQEEGVDGESKTLSVEDELFKQDSMKRSKKRSTKAWIILLFFTPGFLVLIIYLIKVMIDNFFK